MGAPVRVTEGKRKPRQLVQIDKGLRSCASHDSVRQTEDAEKFCRKLRNLHSRQSASLFSGDNASKEAVYLGSFVPNSAECSNPTHQHQYQ